MSNEELIDRFEADSHPEDSFHHADHVRLAFAYLSQYPTLQALRLSTVLLDRGFAGQLTKTLRATSLPMRGDSSGEAYR